MAKIKTRDGVKEHKVVSQKEWVKARKQLLIKEKKFSKARDELNKQRRALPWVKMEKEYIFDGPDGKETIRALERRFCEYEAGGDLQGAGSGNPYGMAYARDLCPVS